MFLKEANDNEQALLAIEVVKFLDKKPLKLMECLNLVKQAFNIVGWLVLW